MSREEANRIARVVQRMRRSRVALKIAIPTAAALGAGAAVAVGSIPGSDGTITGCYAGQQGAVINDVDQAPDALRVIDPGLSPSSAFVPSNAAARECQRDETQITWNQAGPTGPQGPAGLPGAQGPAGPGGGQGATGAAGTSLVGETTFGLQNPAGETFLKLDGIAGESTDKTHKGEINIESFSLGAQSPSGASHGSGAGAGKVSVQTFTITKALDKASPLLFQAAGAGKVLKSAVLSFARKTKGKEQDYLQFKFDNLVVSKLQDGASAGGTPQEEVTFTFQKIDESFVTAGKSVNVGFNIQTNKLN
jgi:type VI secretion system secreted protein Hcp